MSQAAKTPPPKKPAAAASSAAKVKPVPAPKPKPAAKAPPPAKKPHQKRPTAKPARARKRHWGFLMAFLVMVTVPVGGAAWYLYTKAADQYATTLGFTVRSEDTSGAGDLFGTLGSTFGSSTSTRDTDILYEFIRSQEMVALIDARVDLRRIYAAKVEDDPLFGFEGRGTIEDLTAYWQRMVRISYDAGSGLMELRVLAFSPEDAVRIAEAIEEESGRMINALSAQARSDATRFAREELELAEERLRDARAALTAFRVENQIVDVSADIQGQMGLLNTLQTQLATALIEYDLLAQTSREGDSRLLQAQRRIDVIESRIEEERRKFGAGTAAGQGGYAGTVAEFERLTVNQEFAEQAYLAALTSYDNARAEANRQSLYLAAYIQPTLAERAEFPQRLAIITVVSIFAFLSWSILALVYYSLRDSRR